MSSKRMVLSPSGKRILDNFVEILSLTRPQVLKLAFAKGYESPTLEIKSDSDEKGWEIPDILSEDEVLLFKHLIINKLELDISSDLYSEILKNIENGLYTFDQLYKDRNSLDDIRMVILN